MLKTWYFSYSALWSTGQRWGGGQKPPPALPWLRYSHRMSKNYLHRTLIFLLSKVYFVQVFIQHSITRAGHFRKPVRKSANCGLKVLVCEFANRFLTANICGFAVKKLKFTANPQINNISGIVSAISKKLICFYDSLYRQILVDDVFLKYNTL